MSKIVMVSGGYDPLHVGHLRQINHAKTLGQVVVVLNSDEWLMRKKGYVFMPFEERKWIMYSLRNVTLVVGQVGNGDTMAESLRLLKPDYFCKGGDRTPETMPQDEIDVCNEFGIEIVYGCGGEKIQSSSWLVDKVRENCGDCTCNRE